MGRPGAEIRSELIEVALILRQLPECLLQIRDELRLMRMEITVLAEKLVKYDGS